MKNIKYSLLTLTLLAYTSQIIPHYGYGHGGGGFGGGFATGALLGTGLTLAATSGRSESPESRNIRSIDSDIRYERKQIQNINRDYKRGKINAQERDEQIKQHNDNIQSLQRQRSTISA